MQGRKNSSKSSTTAKTAAKAAKQRKHVRNRMADAFEQMIWKSDLHGLLQEASMIGCGLEQYYLETSDNEGEAMRALREKMASTIWSHEWVAKRTMFAYGPEMSTSPGSTVSENTLNDEAAPSDL